jgi:hypothetical protein
MATWTTSNIRTRSSAVSNPRPLVALVTMVRLPDWLALSNSANAPALAAAPSSAIFTRRNRVIAKPKVWFVTGASRGVRAHLDGSGAQAR